MPRIFLSYRRADSLEVTGRIYDRLVECFGPQSVFRDLDSIPLGVPFPQLLRESLAKTDVVLVIIGPTWLSVQNEAGQRRLDQLDDFVRLEVAEALQLGRPVIPVTVGNGRLPPEQDLPESIRGLAQRNGMAVRPDPDFHNDMDRLCVKLQETLGLPQVSARPAEVIGEQLKSLQLQNQQLQTKLELQNQLATIDRKWDEVRQGYRAAGGIPTLPLTIVFIVAGLGAMIAGLVLMGNMPGNGPGRPGLFMGIWVAMGMANLVIHSARYAMFDTERRDYESRRAAAIRRAESAPVP